MYSEAQHTQDEGETAVHTQIQAADHEQWMFQPKGLSQQIVTNLTDVC